MEPYLYVGLSLKQRTILTRFRVSCHSLEIELGRHHRPYVPAEARLCKQCTLGEPQDEVHHLFRCTKWSDQREILFDKLDTMIPNFMSEGTELERLQKIFNSVDKKVLIILSNFLLNTML